MSVARALSRCLVVLSLVCAPLPALADDAALAGIPSIMQMTDYLSVDYPEAVEDGKVKSESEYAEQREFAATVAAKVAALPERPGKAELAAAAGALTAAVDAKAAGGEIGRITAEINRLLMQAYPVEVAPKAAPDLAHGQQLFQANCTACHGAEGRGDGPAAAGLEPPATDFHERARQGQRSPFSLYNTISLGVPGTAMASYSHLSEAERWALAFYLSQLQFTDAERERGAALAAEQSSAVTALADLRELAQTTPDVARERYGDDGVAALAYLRAHPQAVAGKRDYLTVSSQLLDETVAAYRAGDRAAAERLALSAYLEGFELAEASVSAVAPELKGQVESAMIEFRQRIREAAPADAVAAQAQAVKALLDDARGRLQSGSLTPLGSFTGSFVILAREGMEAILVLAAIFAFLRRTERRDALPYVHGGWIVAIVLGIGTWLASAYLINISGASREVTEGVTALVAAVILLYVGFWLHSKSYAERWNDYVRGKLEGALARRNLWALAAVSFLAVYREIFETVLFYRALWEQGNPSAVLAGFAVAAVFLLAVIWAIYSVSLKLPIKQFFGWSSGLIALLAVVFVGNGVAALQEAGRLPLSPIGGFSIPLLGIHGNVEALTAQLVMLLLVIAAFAFNHVAARRLSVSST